MALRTFPVVYASDVETAARFWELLGFCRHVQLPPDGEPAYVGLRRDDGGELAVTHVQWAAERYGLTPGDGPRFEMYVYVEDLEATLRRLRDASVVLLRGAEDMPWGERIATVADPDGNPVALCQAKHLDPLLDEMLAETGGPLTDAERAEIDREAGWE